MLYRVSSTIYGARGIVEIFENHAVHSRGENSPRRHQTPGNIKILHLGHFRLAGKAITLDAVGGAERPGPVEMTVDDIQEEEAS